MKKILFLLLTIAFFSACQKRGELPELPSYATFRMTSSSIAQYYEVMVGDSLLADSLSAISTLSRYVATGKQRLKIKEAGSDHYFIDSLIDIERPGVEYTLVSLGEGTTPLMLSAANLETTPPAAGTRKFSLLNTDTTSILKSRRIDVRFYDLNLDDYTFVKIGELNDIDYMTPSEYVELPLPKVGTYYLEVADHATGELIIPVESYSANMLSPYDQNNVYLMKLYNVGDASWTYISGELLIGLKL